MAERAGDELVVEPYVEASALVGAFGPAVAVAMWALASGLGSGAELQFLAVDSSATHNSWNLPHSV